MGGMVARQLPFTPLRGEVVHRRQECERCRVITDLAVRGTLRDTPPGGKPFTLPFCVCSACWRDLVGVVVPAALTFLCGGAVYLDVSEVFPDEPDETHRPQTGSTSGR